MFYLIKNRYNLALDKFKNTPVYIHKFFICDTGISNDLFVCVKDRGSLMCLPGDSHARKLNGTEPGFKQALSPAAHGQNMSQGGTPE